MSATLTAEPQNAVDLKRDLESLRKDVRELKADIRGLFQDSMAFGREKVGQSRERLSEEMQTAREKGRETWDLIKGEMEDHPLGTLAVAFLAGVVAGFFFPKRG